LTEGLYELDGEYYYVQGNKEIAVNKDIYVTTQLLDGTGWYRFDGEGKLIKNGFADCGGFTFYFTDGIRAKGFTKIGDDYYIFNTYSGKMYKDANMWVGDNPYGIEGGMHYFDKDGKMFIPDLENGEKKIVNENGKLYFTVDGVKVSEGLYELDGDYYYVQGNKEIAVNKAFYLYNDELKGGVGWYKFGNDGKLITDGFVECDGKIFYFSGGERAKGFTKIGEDYYIFNTYSGMMYKDADMWVGDNPYGIAGGMHYFDKDGKMVG
jgi:Mor family transcriptional regulator